MKKNYEKPEISVVSVKSEENITDGSSLTNDKVQTTYGLITYSSVRSDY
ncbi:MAG: hypothetical protein LIO87_05715 [Eubacterium sp.]|nr:hypothetical protein [Eubacterium sp.]